nr:hypothetical protein [Sphingomonas liriopis]
MLAASLALFWPGYVAYDSLAQYHQALSGRYDDWHPPVMAHLWSLFGAAGPAPMLLVQMGLYWSGFGALAVALTLRRRRHAAFGILIVALWPPLLGWQAVVLKDTQMLAALLAGAGIVGWFLLRERAVPAGAWAVAALPFGYALLVRANAPFAVVPLVVMLACRTPRWWPRLLATAAGVVLAIGLAGPVNHRLLGAAPSGVERTQAIYDLAGIGVRTGDPATGIAAPALDRLRAGRCVRPFFWDPLGGPGACATGVAGLRAMSVGTLYGLWAGAALHHPLAYAAHRLAHLNSTERWLVPAHWYGAAPPEASEANAYRFGEPGPRARRWQRLAAWLIETPLGWPILWVVLGVAGFVAALPGESGGARLATALFASALAQEASFAVVSIASDLRYHLWSMTAVAIGWVVLGRRPRGWAIGIALLMVLAAGTAARLILPVAPQTYAGMLG